MVWAVLTLIGTLFEAGSFLVEKKGLAKEHAMEFAAASAIIAMVVTTPFWIFADTVNLSLGATFWIFMAGLGSSFSILFFAKATRHMAVSYTAPFLAAGPVITLLLAAIFFGENITLIQGCGILVIMIGAYVLHSHEHDSILDPFRHFFKVPQMKYIWLTILAYAVTGILDKKVVGSGELNVPLLTFIPLLFFFIGIIFIVFMLIFHDGFDGIARGLKKNKYYLGSFAVLTVGMKVMLLWAISIPGALLSLIIPLKKMSSLFTTVIGGKIFEEEHLVRKSIACVIMILGAVLILL